MGARYLMPCKNTNVSGRNRQVCCRQTTRGIGDVDHKYEGVSVKHTVIMTERKKKRKKSGKEKSDGADLRQERKFIGFATNMQLKDSELYSKR